jgi:hypothetical protein
MLVLNWNWSEGPTVKYGDGGEETEDKLHSYLIGSKLKESTNL